MDSNGTPNLKVVDIYHGDGTVDFVYLKSQGYDGVFIKATQGLTFQDNMCATNYAKAQAAGLHTGFYHYYNISNTNGAAQAAFFLSAIQNFTSDYLPVMDVELTDYNSVLSNPTALSQAVSVALDVVKAKIGGSMLYSNPATLKQLKSSILGGYPLWIAEYDSSQVQDVPGFGPWTGWQYTDTPLDTSKFTQYVFLTSVPVDQAVLDVQKKLIRLQIGNVQPTGVMDAATKAATQTFQSTQGLVQDGIWGPKTEAAYQAIAAKPLLQQGSTGGPVGYVQYRVFATVDRIFGPKTKSAVMAFQKARGLSQDGIVGPKTWAALIG